jgi:hypothetical protein
MAGSYCTAGSRAGKGRTTTRPVAPVPAVAMVPPFAVFGGVAGAELGDFLGMTALGGIDCR